jgi:hypothetical protein
VDDLAEQLGGDEGLLDLVRAANDAPSEAA